MAYNTGGGKKVNPCGTVPGHICPGIFGPVIEEAPQLPDHVVKIIDPVIDDNPEKVDQLAANLEGICDLLCRRARESAGNSEQKARYLQAYKSVLKLRDHVSLENIRITQVSWEFLTPYIYCSMLSQKFPAEACWSPAAGMKQAKNTEKTENAKKAESAWAARKTAGALTA